MPKSCGSDLKNIETTFGTQKENVQVQEFLNNTGEEYVVYPIRWVMLIIFAVYSASNGIQVIQYSIIQDAVVKYYGVTSLTVYWTSMVFMIVYVPLVLPGTWIVDKMGLGVAITTGAFGNCACSWLKVFSVSQDRFWLGFIGQVLAGISQIFILSLPPKVAAVWFGADQVSTACSIGVFGYQVGIAIGMVVPPLIVHTQNSNDQIAAEFQLMFNIVAGFNSLLLAAVLLIFREAPATPPSKAAALGSSVETNFLQSMKNLLTNWNYILLVLSYGIIVGVNYVVAVVLNEIILSHYPNKNKDVGCIGLVFLLAGMVGSVVFGFLLDKTHRFKETTVTISFASVASMVLFTFTLTCGQIGVVYFTCALLGFFLIGYLAVGLEFAAELTYPEPEGITLGFLNAVLQVIAITLMFLYEWMLRVHGDWLANLVVCVVLTLGAVLSAGVQSDLRRQAVQRGITYTTMLKISNKTVAADD